MEKHATSDSVYLDDEPRYKGVVGTPPGYNWKQRPPYSPPKMTPLRPGAQDADKLKSRGYPC
jgi:hypothetical protein